MTMSTDTIALQVVSFDTKKKDLSDLCSNVRINLEKKIEDIKQRYSLELLYVKRFQCNDGNYEINAISLEDLKTQDSYYCQYHKYAHESKMIYLPWTKKERKMNDGPISLLDATHSFTLDVDTDQRSDCMKTKPSNQSNDTYADGQPNGDENLDQFCNVENLKDEDLLSRMQEMAATLKAMEDYDQEEGLKLMKSIADLFGNHLHINHKIGHILYQQQFAETAMKVLTSINIKGFFITEENKQTVLNTQHALANFTDASLEFAKSVAQHGGVKYLTDICNMYIHRPCKDNWSSKEMFRLVKYSLCTLHNIAKHSNVQHYYTENATSDVMIPFLQSKEEHAYLKITAMLTLAHIVEVEENDKFTDNTGAIEGIVSYIRLALKNELGYHEGFEPIELMDGLSKLAVNDINKIKIVDAGALPLLLRMLKRENIEEHAVASKALWTLSFDKDVAQKIRDFEDLMPTLEKLSGSEDQNVEKNCKGALFLLKGENDVKNHSTVGAQ